MTFTFYYICFTEKIQTNEGAQKNKKLFQNFYHLQLNRNQVRIYSKYYLSEVLKVIRDYYYSNES